MAVHLAMKELVEKYHITTAPEHKPNFFQISRFPQYENVFSNVLAFFLEDSSAHNFGNLIFRCLIRCIPQVEKLYDKEHVKKMRSFLEISAPGVSILVYELHGFFG